MSVARALRRALAVLAKLAAVVALGLVLAAGLLILRISQGPLPLDALTPVIERALADEDGSLRVRIGATELALVDNLAALAVRARDVRVGNRTGGGLLAIVPELDLSFSVDALFHGIIAPKRIVVGEPSVHLRRDADGGFAIDIGEEGESGGAVLAQSLQALLAPPDPAHPAGYLQEISLRNARLTVDDRMLGTAWTAPRVAAAFFRNQHGISGDLALVVDIDGTSAELHADFSYGPDEDRVTARIGVTDWDVAKLARIAPPLAPLTVLHAPVSGMLQLAVAVATRRLQGARLDLTAAAGTLVGPGLPGGAVPLAGAVLAASYDPERGRLALDNLALDLAGPAVTVTATVDGLDTSRILNGVPPLAWGELGLALAARVERMPAAALERFWPPGLGANARAWVTANIRDGVVDEASLAARLHLRADGIVTALDEFSGGMRMRGLTIDYLRPLPPVREVDGSARFDRSRMTLLPVAGKLKDLRVTGGTILITDLDKVDQDIDIALAVSGPLRDALELVDGKPFDYVRQVGIVPAAVEGAAETSLSLKFPLDHRTSLDQITLDLRSQLSGVKLAKIAFGRDLTQGNLQLRLDRASMRVEGEARLAGAPATLAWTEVFKPRDGVRSRYAVRGRLDDAARRELGLANAAVSIRGPVEADATATGFADKRSEATIALDLREAAVAVPDLNWSKPAGAAAAARVELLLADGRLAAIREATAKGTGIDIGLSATLAPREQSLERVEIARMVVGESDLRGTISRRKEGGWRAELQGLAFDATTLAADLAKPSPSPSKEAGAPLVVDGKFDRVILGAKREIRAVALQYLSDGLHVQSLGLDAGLIGGGVVKLRFGQAAGARPFTFSTSDLGAALRVLDISDHIAGGQLNATGRAEDQGAARIVSGHVEGSDYRVVGAPALARLLSLASFSGVGALLAGEGIPFARLVGDFSAQDGKVQLRDGRAWGGALGINAGGTVDLAGNTLDLQGTLVPAYMLNSILGNIPIIGNMLMGGEGQGLFAAEFKAAGPLDDPQVWVNPLSALAPGFLRKLFQFEGQGDAPAPAPRGDSH